MKRRAYPPLPDLNEPARSRSSAPDRNYLPIHIAPKPDADRALCGNWILVRPTQIRTVELGRVKLEDVELEAGWIGNVVRRPEAPRVTDLCRPCLEKVGKLRDGKARPEMLAAEKSARRIAKMDEARAKANARALKRNQDKIERAETKRRNAEAKASQIAKERELVLLQREARRRSTWEAVMFDAANEND